MKKLYKYIVLVIGILALSACADEELVGSFGESGNDVILKLKVQTQAKNNVNVSRVADDEMLYDLHFYVFDQDGILTGHMPVTGNSLTSPSGSVTIKAKTGTSYIYAVANINVGVYYTLEETDKELLNNPDGKLTLPKLKEIKFKRKISEDGNILSPKPEDKYYMMSGYMNDGNPVSITQYGIYNEAEEKIDIVYLYRILAKNTLTIKTFSTESDEYEKDENGNNVLDNAGKPIKKRLYRGKFTPKSYRLCKVPVGGVLIPNTNISTTSQYLQKTGDDGKLSDNITEDEVESSYFVSSMDSVFTFYYPENLQIPKDQSYNDNGESLINEWEDREKNLWDKTDNTKTFTYAADNASYIEIEGTYEYQGEYQDEEGVIKNEKINANVTYTIHLGDFVTDIQDFNVIRNSNYTYEVVVNGVDDIIAEATRNPVENPSYDNPYAEGIVIRTTTGEHYDVDAHYEARVMAFNLEELRTLQRQNLGFFLNIETPFKKMDEVVFVKNDGVYSLSNTTTPLCGIHNVETRFSKDDLFGWVRFVENGAVKYKKNDNGSYSEDGTNLLVAGGKETHVCRYPGDDKKKYSYTTGTDKTITKRTDYAGGWMNAFELLADLYTKALTSTDGFVYYTCFIDENYYANRSWLQYVNQAPRKIQIANTLSESPDGKSIYADAAYSVSQRSIATFYQNTNKTAFGTEIIDEEDKYSKDPYNYENIRMGEMGSIAKYTIFPPSTTNQDNWDGYTNAVTTNNGMGWYDHEINETQLVQYIPNSQPLYAAVGKACMSRNRDLNGDGLINDDTDPSKNEIRWYLASVQQYHALYIAKNSLPAESHLISDIELQAINIAYTTDIYGDANTWDGDITYDRYGRVQKNENDPSGHDFRGKFHYYTSSNKDGAGTYWPEEGMTNNGVEKSSSFMQRAELVRCVRTLGTINGTNNEKYGLGAPQKYYTFEKNTFDLSGIETRRTAMPMLPNHHELQLLNELSPKFEVATNSLYQSASYSLLNLTSQEKDPCKDEYSQEANGADKGTWRTPNQKEVALMLAEIPGEMTKTVHGTRTRFSGYESDNNPNAVSWHGPYFWHTRYGFSIERNGKFNVTGDNASVNIRCVRDK